MTYTDAQHLIPHEPTDDGAQDETPTERLHAAMRDEHARGEHEDEPCGDCPICEDITQDRLQTMGVFDDGREWKGWSE